MSGPVNGDSAPAGLRRAVFAFTELVAERGYQNVELAEIDERAGLEPGSAERLLPDRLTYFQAGWEQLEAEFVRQLRAAYRPQQGWRSQLRAAVREAARLLETYPTQAHYLAVDALAVGEQGRARQQALATRLAVFLDEARAESEHADEGAGGDLGLGDGDHLRPHLPLLGDRSRAAVRRGTAGADVPRGQRLLRPRGGPRRAARGGRLDIYISFHSRGQA